MIRGYLFKISRNPLTYIGFLGVFAVCLLNLNGLMINEHTTVLQRIDLFLDLDAFRKLVTIFAAVPFTANFADEWKHNITASCISRKGIKKYALSNMSFCVITAFLAVFIGIMLYMLLASTFSEFDRPGKYFDDVLPYSELMNMGLRWLYPVIRIFVFSASCAVWCSMGLMLSAIVPNKYIAICSPVVASYVIEQMLFQSSKYINLMSLSLSNCRIGSSVTTFLYTMLVFAGITAVCGFLFYYFLRKRVQNEIN